MESSSLNLSLVGLRLFHSSLPSAISSRDTTLLTPKYFYIPLCKILDYAVDAMGRPSRTCHISLFEITDLWGNEHQCVITFLMNLLYPAAGYSSPTYMQPIGRSWMVVRVGFILLFDDDNDGTIGEPKTFELLKN